MKVFPLSVKIYSIILLHAPFGNHEYGQKDNDHIEHFTDTLPLKQTAEAAFHKCWKRFLSLLVL